MSDKHRRILALSLSGYPKIQDWGMLEYPRVFLHHLFYGSQRQVVFPMEGKRAFLVFLFLYIYVYIHKFLTGRHIKTKHLHIGPANWKQGSCMVQAVWCCWIVIYPTFRKTDLYGLYLQLIGIVRKASEWKNSNVTTMQYLIDNTVVKYCATQ